MPLQSNAGWVMTGFGREALQWRELPMPTPVAGEVRVRVLAVGLNYRDMMVIDGNMFPELPFPLVPGSDAYGEIDAVGPGVAEFKPGDRVITSYHTAWSDGPQPESIYRKGDTLGGPLQGVLSRYCCLPEQALVRAPGNLGLGEAASLPIAGLTAWSALMEHGEVRAGEIVVVQGTGGVALWALQLASGLGARVIVTSGDDNKLEAAKHLGAWQGINYRRFPAWDEQVLELTNGRGSDLILETVGGENLERSANAAAVNGRIALIGFLGGMELRAGMVPFLLKELKLFGLSVGSRGQLRRLVEHIERQNWQPLVERLYPAGELKAALDHLEKGPFGKVVVRLDK